MPAPEPPVAEAFVLYTIVPVSKPEASGEDELTSVKETRGNTKPLLVVSISRREALLIVVELSPIFTCDIAVRRIISMHKMRNDLVFINNGYRMFIELYLSSIILNTPIKIVIVPK